MTESSVAYLQAALGITSVIIAVIFYLSWRVLGHKPWALKWSGTFILVGVYWGATVTQSIFPSYESYWLFATACAISSVYLGLDGHCQRTGSRLTPVSIWPFAVLSYFAVLWTTLMAPHGGLSAAILPFTSAITLFISAYMIVTHRKRTRLAEWAAASMLTVFAMLQLPAVWFLISLGTDPTIVAAGIFTHPSMLIILAGFVGVAMFVIFMLASDLSEDMREIAIRDQLTGLLNRRGFGEYSANAYAQARRSERSVSVIMADIDHFKNVNDQFGHAAGDLVLVQFAELIARDRRAEDIVARLGGEEFVIILPGTDVRKGTAIADELCKKMAAEPLVVEGRQVEMTASFGVAAISDKDTCMTDIIIRADKALYRSKRAGRNRVDLESSQIMRATDGTLEAVS
ncbi:MAG: GGDEF domain-containing protein [Pseudomonadota bacterium]